MPDCINLAQLFGARYRITFDPAYDPKHRPKDKLDPWMMQIPGRYGTIYPHGGKILAVEIDGHPLVAGPLRRLPFVRVLHDGDREVTLVFDVEHFETVAKLVRPHRLPRMSDQAKAAAVERLRAFQYHSHGAPPQQIGAETHA